MLPGVVIAVVVTVMVLVLRIKVVPVGLAVSKAEVEFQLFAVGLVEIWTGGPPVTASAVVIDTGMALVILET